MKKKAVQSSTRSWVSVILTLTSVHQSGQAPKSSRCCQLLERHRPRPPPKFAHAAREESAKTAQSKQEGGKESLVLPRAPGVRSLRSLPPDIHLNIQLSFRGPTPTQGQTAHRLLAPGHAPPGELWEGKAWEPEISGRQVRGSEGRKGGSSLKAPHLHVPLGTSKH